MPAPGRWAGYAGASGSRWVAPERGQRPTRRDACPLQPSGNGPSDYASAVSLIGTRRLDDVGGLHRNAASISICVVSSKRASGGGLERRHGALAVAGVAAVDVGEHHLVAQRARRGRQAAASGARARTSGVAVTNSLARRSGHDDACRCRGRRGPRPARGGQRRAGIPGARHGRREWRRPGGGLAGGGRAQARRRKTGLNRGRGRRGRRPRHRRRSWPRGPHRQADGAVEQAGVEMVEAKMRRQAGVASVPLPEAAGPSTAMIIGARPLSNWAPKPLHQPWKSGKLVAIMRCVVDGDRVGGGEAHDEEGHGDAVVHEGRDQAAAADRDRHRPRANPRRCGTRHHWPRARRQWRPFDRFPSPAARGGPPSGWCPRQSCGNRKDREFVDHRGGASGRDKNAAQRRAPRPDAAQRLAARLPLVVDREVALPSRGGSR